MPGAIVALNAGSSSIKFALVEVREGAGLGLMSKGGIEGIGGDPHFTATGADGSMLDDKRWRRKDAEYDAMPGALLAWAEWHVQPDTLAALGSPRNATAARLHSPGPANGRDGPATERADAVGAVHQPHSLRRSAR